MLALTTAQSDAIIRRRVKRRMFIWCEATDPDTLLPAPTGFWDDVHNIEDSGRTYYGSANIIAVSSMAARSDSSITGLKITISGIAPEAAALVRASTVGQAPIELLMGIYDVDTDEVLPPLIRRFKGWVDTIDINTPEAGGKSTIVLGCESQSRALTIRYYRTRSQEICHERNSADEFYKYTGGQAEKVIYFGRKAPE